MNDTRDTLVDTLRRNPIPAALAGIGIAWLLMNRSSASRTRGGAVNTSSGGYNPYQGMGYGPTAGRNEASAMSGVGNAFSSAQHAVAETASNVAHRVGDVAGHVGTMVGNAAGQVSGAVGHAGEAVTGAARAAHDAGAAARGAIDTGAQAVTHLAHDAQAAAGQLAHRAGDAAGHLVHRAGDAAGSVAGAAREQAGRVEGGIASAWDANPLAFGAAALAAGAALGYALPRTAKEDQLMGEVRDRAVHGVDALATEAVHSLQHVAEDVGRAAKEGAKSATR